MTALKDFDRLESTGIWHAGPDAQRRDVVVSVGDATLAIFDMNDRALTHWSLAALERLNPGIRPAVFTPGADADERLELDDDTMIDAIEKVRRVVERNRPRRGRLRYYITAGSLAVVAGLAIFWLPGAMIRHTIMVVPPAVRAYIGAQLLETIQRVAGRPCAAPDGTDTLNTLAARLLPDRKVRLIVLSRGVASSEHLPGGYILLNRALIEDFEGPAPVAGFILAEDERARVLDPLERLLLTTGTFSAFRLLISGRMDVETLESYAEALLIQPPAPLEPEDLLERFRLAEVGSTAYAYARDITGEATLPLIEGDPMAGREGRIILTDGQWVTLQGICGE
ncbi:hypothetical protein [Oceaniovalibus sp. ACAM 378]|uniref:hypothetical protein n=1 Tax=Oceaniovalibus sp. ACAM 378 TaxID=2599923 RepID=UPI0011D4F8F5|nr:hypothetical protein [Oceaniovalibus sp. ACAM 378]TYB87059.1 hypothetical protein FQ320_14600 [Oceaniovalibus sp. ACAM 378]